MFCLLCHEKISRLRAWRTKSEFCCDEHAEVYKRQTLERLLTDQENGKPGEAPPLPVEAAASAGNSDEHEPAGEPAEPTGAAAALARFEEQDRASAARQGLELAAEPESLEAGGRDEGLQELWRLAEEASPSSAEASGDDDWGGVPGTFSESSSPFHSGGLGSSGGDLGSSLGSLGRGLGSGPGGVREQTAEEALAALRELSSGSGRSRLEESRDEVDALLSARDAAPRHEVALGAADEEELTAAALDDALAGDEALPLLDAASLEPLDDEELPSILARLTEQPAEAEQLDWAAAPAEEQPAKELDPVAEVRAEAEQPEEAEVEPAQAADDGEEQAPAAASSEDSAALGELGDLIEEAVESHLDEPAAAGHRGSSHKVVPFPLSRPKTVSREQPEESSWPASEPAASAADERGRTRKSGKGLKSAQGMPGDLSRLQLRPVAVMFGIEPGLYTFEENGEEWAPSGLARPAQGVAEPPMYYPDAGGGRPVAARLPVHARLFPLLPEMPDSEPLVGPGAAEGPDYALPCETPLPLAARRGEHSGRPSVGSERAWMFQIEPALAEGPEFAMDLPNGKRHAPWLAPRFPAALVSAVGSTNGSGKLDLSGPRGGFEPPVDHLCLVFPELGELGAGIPRQSSKAPGEGLGKWMPPTVLDPRFDIERPAGRDLSDFG